MNTQPNRYGLVICRTLAKRTEPVRIEDLILFSWMEDRETMGLKGYEIHYPDARKVQNTIYGRRCGLRAAGLIALVDGGYIITEAGRKAAENWPTNPGNLSLRAPAIIRQGMRCRAMQLFREGQIERVTWKDALDLWGKLPPADFTEAVAALDDDDQQVREVGRLHEALLNKFAVRLKLTA